MLRATLLAVATLLVGLAAASPLLVPAWTVKLPSLPAATPVAALGGTTYFVEDFNGTVWSIDTATHKIKWSLRWDDISSLMTFPEQDALIVFLQEGTWSVRASTGELPWVNNTVQLGTSAVAAGKWLLGFNSNAANIQELTCYDAVTGAIKWATPSLSFVTSIPFTVNNIVLVANNSIPSSILAFNADDGSLAWNKAYGTLVGAGNGVVVALNQSNASFLSQDLYLLDPATGNVKLHIPNYTQTSNVLVSFDPNGNLILSDSITFISAIDGATYKLLWFQSLAQTPSLAFGVKQLILSSNAILALSNANQTSQNQLFNVSALRRDTGEIKWTIVMPPTTASELVLCLGAYIYVPNLIGFTAWSEATGALLFNTYSDIVPVVGGTQFFLSSNTFIAQTPDGSVSAFNF